MNGWRIEATVLTDLTASMFAACFIVLLIFLQLAQRPDRPTAPQSIETTRELVTTRQRVLSPAEMVDLLHVHGGGGDGAGIDLFADRADLRLPGETAPATVAPAAFSATLAGLPAGPVRLYVFSNDHYAALRGALGARPVLEMSVPDALRDAARPMRAWSAEFQALDAEPLDAASFRRRLAALLAAAGERAGGGRAGAEEPRGGFVASDLVARLGSLLSFLASAAVPLAGFAAVAWIERRRWAAIRTAVTSDTEWSRNRF